MSSAVRGGYYGMTVRLTCLARTISQAWQSRAGAHRAWLVIGARRESRMLDGDAAAWLAARQNKIGASRVSFVIKAPVLMITINRSARLVAKLIYRTNLCPEPHQYAARNGPAEPNGRDKLVSGLAAMR
jgi:hypothetical protein